jgi:hypothetical protein
MSNLDGDCGFVFYDGPTPQVYLFVLNTTGQISLYPGNVYGPGYPNNPPIAASAASVAANVPHMIEWDISFGPASAYNIYLDGVNVLSGIGNTQQSSNGWANNFAFWVHAGFNGSTFTLDDVYFFNSTGAYNNAVLLSNPTVYTDFPIADHLKQFTNIGNVVGDYFGPNPLDPSNAYNTNAFATGASIGANNLYLQPITPNVNCTINSIGVCVGSSGSGATVNMRGVLYSDGSGAPNTLLSNGTATIGITPGAITTLPLSTPTALTAGTQYWIGFINDAQFNVQYWDWTNIASGTGGVVYNGRIVANTYASGPPSTAPAMTPGQRSVGIFGACTGAATNWQSEAYNHPPLAGVAGVQSATIGIEDLYQYPGLPTNIGSVYTVSVSGNTYVSGPGVRKYNLVALSGATTGYGSNTGIQAISNQTWGQSYFDVDPATAVPWTRTGVSNGFYGMLVTA